MIFKWENDKERTLRLMSIPAKKKLEWLRQMSEFVSKCSSKRDVSIKRKLRKESM